MFNGLHTVAQGSVGLAVAIAELAKKGFKISIPLVDAQEYDLIVDDGNKLLKVQVKTTGYKRRDRYEVQLKRVHHNKTGNQLRPFDASLVDVLVVLCSDNSIYIIPSTEINAKNSLALVEKYDKWKI